MVRSLGYSVSIGPSERKGQGEAEEGKGDELLTPRSVRNVPHSFPLSPSKSLAEKRIAVAVVDSVSIHRVLVSNIPSTVLLRQTQQLLTQ